ncbi:MAG: hypothetical protein GY833_25430 [Aestuariibacter sp.]|nr:hypothetical protein [Aestuariibacter sp.]
MAKKIQAIQKFGPKLRLGRAADEDEYIDLVTRNSGVSRGEVLQIEAEDVEALIYLLKQGRPVHTTTAIYTPIIKQDGHIDVNVRLRGGVEGQLNVPGEFKGDVVNADNIGKSTDELCDQWDVEFPGDLIER